MFQSVKNQVSFPEVEKEILEFWQKNNIFKKVFQSGIKINRLFSTMAHLLPPGCRTMAIY